MIRAQSDKRRAQQKRRRDMAAPLRGERCGLQLDVCTGRFEHFHELVGSGQGGSRTDPRNIVPSCDACNSALEGRDDRYERRLKVRRRDAVPGDGGLIPADDHPLALATGWWA